MDYIPLKRISIQVSLSGYSFKLSDSGKISSESGWKSLDEASSDVLSAEDAAGAELSFMTPKVSLVPSAFFDAAEAKSILSRTVALGDGDEVRHVSLPEYSAELLYSLSGGEAALASVMDGMRLPAGCAALPEMYFILKAIREVGEYNRIVASYADGYLYLAISQGGNLLLSNVFEAADFTTAEYFIFLAVKKLQLNPEVSTICFRTPLSDAEEMSLYRYFKGVERL